MKNKNQKENWEKEFDENFESEIKGLGGIWESYKIKSFIRQLLLKQEREDLRLCSADILRAQEIERNKCKSEKEELLEQFEKRIPDVESINPSYFRSVLKIFKKKLEDEK